jgi:hypothetical protein
MSEQDETVVVRTPQELGAAATRRSFLRALGLGGTVVLLPSVFAACDDDDDVSGVSGNGPVTLNLATDTGILNYAYALEQLEAAFYTQAVASAAFGGMSAQERELLTDIRNHEVIHREFLRAALAGNALPDLQVNFGTALGDRGSILTTARTFEDLGVAAYNGAGKYLASRDFLLLAGKIVSVEARHAAAIRDTIDVTGTAFADLAALAQLGAVAADGLDAAMEPAQVLAAADPFITTDVRLGTPPTP